MKLYHGTNAAYLDAILAHGLKPRGKENRRSNWDHSVKSRAGHVYLTSSYGFYFAHSAVKTAGPNTKGMVIELELTPEDEQKLYPDEDFIAQAQELGDKSGNLTRPTLITRTRRVNLEDYKQSWPVSLQHMGNVCFKGTIPASRITRVAIIDVKARMDLVMGYGDNCVSILSYSVMRPAYEGFINWLFGDKTLLPTGMGGMDIETLEREGGLWSERAKAIREQSKDRHGIEVRKVRP